jgi:26S proteasome regulatory subunit T5
VLRDESSRLTHEKAGLAERVKENHEKIKLNNQLPYLVANIVEVLDVDPEEEEEEDGERGEPAVGAAGQAWAVGCCRRLGRHAYLLLPLHGRSQLAAPRRFTHIPRAAPSAAGAGAYQDAGKKGKCIVLKTSTRQTVFLPVAGLVEPERLKPGDLVGVNKDSYLILDTLPAEYDSR